MSDAERAAIRPFPFKAWGQRDLAAIPVPQFVHSDFYAHGHTSVTLAASKVGKSMLALAEAVDMAAGRGLLTGQSSEPLRVVHCNAEDDEAAIEARVAALLTLHGIDQSEIADRLFVHSGVSESAFYLVSGQDPVISEALFVALKMFCRAAKADVLISDPLQDLTRSPETNEVFRALGQRLRLMASSCQVALGLIHHTRKVTPGMSSPASRPRTPAGCSLPLLSWPTTHLGRAASPGRGPGWWSRRCWGSTSRRKPTRRACSS